MEHKEYLIPEGVANLLPAYIEKYAELVALDAKVSLLKAQFKDDSDWVRAKEAAAIFGWKLPKHEDKKEASDD